MIDDQSSRWLSRSAAVAGMAWLAYAVAYLPLHSVLDTYTDITAFVPVILTAWCCGAIAGTVAGLATIPLTVLLSVTLGNSGAQAWVSQPALLGAAAMAFSGYAVGRMRDLRATADMEATERRRSERALYERDERLALVNEITRSMKTDAQPATIVPTAVRSVHQRFPEFRTSYSNIASDGTVTTACVAGPDETFTTKKQVQQPLRGDSLEQLRKGDLIVANDAEAAVSSGGFSAEETGAFVHAPQPNPDGSVGVLSLESPTRHPWTQHELELLRDAADFLTLTLTDAERRLHLIESEQKFRSLADESDINISMMQSDGIIYANPAMERMTGYTEEELKHLDFLELVDPEFREIAEDRAMRRFQGERLSEPLEIKVRSKSGDEVWIDFQGSTVQMGGKPTLLSFGVDVTARKLAEELLLESESRLRNVLEHHFDGLAVVVQGKIVYVNPAVSNMWGYDAAHFIGSDPAQFLVPGDRDRARERIRNQASGDDPNEAEYEALRKDGTTFPLEVLSRPIQYGGAPALLSTLRDVTQRKHHEQALREAESKYRSLVENSLAGVYVVQENRFVYVNPRFAEIFGYTQSEILEAPSLRALAIEEDRPFLDEQVQVRPMDSSDAGAHRFRANRKDGQVIHVEVHGGRTRYVGRPAIIGTILDVTERQLAETALRDSEERFRAMFEQGPIGMVLASPETRFVQVNAAFCEMLGYTEAELIGRSFVDITHPEDAGGTPESAQKVFEDAESAAVRLNKRYLRKDGTLVQAETTVSFVRDASGQVLGAVAMIEDVTERRELEEQLQQMQRLESVGQLAGGVAHNFNNALTAIYGYSELLARRFDATDPALKDLEQIQRVAEQSAELTRQLLAFSRKERVRPSVFCLNDAVETTRDLLTPLIGEHIRFRLRLDRKLGNVHCDRTYMEQVITNLILNARDAMPDGGVLTIETKAVTLSEAFSRTNAEANPGPSVRLTVSDTGAGMDDETVSRVFEPFFTTKEPGEGVGLGLAMVHGAVKQSGGFVTAKSKLGVGSTFACYLPEVRHVEQELDTDAHASATLPDVPDTDHAPTRG